MNRKYSAHLLKATNLANRIYVTVSDAHQHLSARGIQGYHAISMPSAGTPAKTKKKQRPKDEPKPKLPRTRQGVEENQERQASSVSVSIWDTCVGDD